MEKQIYNFAQNKSFVQERIGLKYKIPYLVSFFNSAIPLI